MSSGRRKLLLADDSPTIQKVISLTFGDEGFEVVAVGDGDWLRLPKDTPRRIQNTTDREAVWLTIGAPPGEGITDGIRLDPATGEEIPRG